MIGEYDPGIVLAGKFRIMRCLGSGGMGAVYEVFHMRTQQRCALKLLHSEVVKKPSSVRRFIDEASAAALTRSPHVVSALDAGELPSGEPYLLMELLEGESLREVLDREAPLPPALACELVAQAAEGLAAVHAAKIIHRDLKPENLFLTRDNGRLFVKVLDFGVSKFETSSMATEGGSFLGTLAYTAPEQLYDSAAVDPRADVFALGAVLFECLSRETPYQAGTRERLIGRLITRDWTRLDALRGDLEPSLVSIVHEAVAPLLEQRTASAAQLARALEPFRLAKPVNDTPRPQPKPVAPERRRRPWVAIATVATLTSAGLGIALWKDAQTALTAQPPPLPDFVEPRRVDEPERVHTQPDGPAPSEKPRPLRRHAAGAAASRPTSDAGSRSAVLKLIERTPLP